MSRTSDGKPQGTLAKVIAVGARARLDEDRAAADRTASCMLLFWAEILSVIRHRESAGVPARIVPDLDTYLTATTARERWEATLRLSYLGHLRLMDDSYGYAFHPGVVVNPVSANYWRTESESGAPVFGSIRAGYEVGCALADILLPGAPRGGWRVTSVIAPLVSAYVASCLLGHDDAAASRAVALASSTTGGVLASVRGKGTEWAAQPALSLLTGMACAEDWTWLSDSTDSDALDTEFGFFDQFQGDPSGFDAIRHDRVMDVAFKVRSAPMYSQGLAIALEHILRSEIDPSEIVRLEVGMPEFALGYANNSAGDRASVASIEGMTRRVLALSDATNVDVAAESGMSRYGAQLRVSTRTGEVRAFGSDFDSAEWAWSDAVAEGERRTHSSNTPLIEAINAVRAGAADLVEVLRAVHQLANIPCPTCPS